MRLLIFTFIILNLFSSVLINTAYCEDAKLIPSELDISNLTEEDSTQHADPSIFNLFMQSIFTSEENANILTPKYLDSSNDITKKMNQTLTDFTNANEFSYYSMIDTLKRFFDIRRYDGELSNLISPEQINFFNSLGAHRTEVFTPIKDFPPAKFNDCQLQSANYDQSLKIKLFSKFQARTKKYFQSCNLDDLSLEFNPTLFNKNKYEVSVSENNFSLKLNQVSNSRNEFSYESEVVSCYSVLEIVKRQSSFVVFIGKIRTLLNETAAHSKNKIEYNSMECTFDSFY